MLSATRIAVDWLLLYFRLPTIDQFRDLVCAYLLNPGAVGFTQYLAVVPSVLASVYFRLGQLQLAWEFEFSHQESEIVIKCFIADDKVDRDFVVDRVDLPIRQGLRLRIGEKLADWGSRVILLGLPIISTNCLVVGIPFDAEFKVAIPNLWRYIRSNLLRSTVLLEISDLSPSIQLEPFENLADERPVGLIVLGTRVSQLLAFLFVRRVNSSNDVLRSAILRKRDFQTRAGRFFCPDEDVFVLMTDDHSAFSEFSVYPVKADC